MRAVRLQMGIFTAALLATTLAAVAFAPGASAYLPTLTFHEARQYIDEIQENDSWAWELRGCWRDSRLRITCRDQEWPTPETDPGWSYVYYIMVYVTPHNRLRSSIRLVAINGGPGSFGEAWG
jgi:hypothetical protein